MQTFINAVDLQESLRETRAHSHKVGFVPTMGALHEGHMSLFKEAKRHCDYVAASIFVNPKQFGPNEDFASYPRTLKDDLSKLELLEIDAAFIPNAKDIYPNDFQTFIFNSDMSDVLCGRYRPGHFQGVLTVVNKLMNLVRPDVAIFGRKDYQQFRIIEKMVSDLNMPIDVVGAPTMREADGLAMSSRNRRLDTSHRAEAAALFRGLSAANDSFKEGNKNSRKLVSVFEEALQGTSLNLQYAEIRDQKSLAEFEGDIDQPAVFAVAAYLGDVRLIDNIELGL